MLQFKIYMEGASYTGVVLDPESRNHLLAAIMPILKSSPQDFSRWETVATHMTVNMKNFDPTINPPELLGRMVELKATYLAWDGKVVAVRVDTPVNSVNETKHITLLVNRDEGGKPVMSNYLVNWKPIQPLSLRGQVEEI